MKSFIKGKNHFQGWMIPEVIKKVIPNLDLKLAILFRTTKKQNFYGKLQHKDVLIRVLHKPHTNLYLIERFVGPSNKISLSSRLKSSTNKSYKVAIKKAISLYNQIRNKTKTKYKISAEYFSDIPTKADWKYLSKVEPCKVPFQEIKSDKLVKNKNLLNRLTLLEL